MIHFDPPLQGRTLQGVYSNLFIGIIAFVGLFFFTHPVFAYDLTITCDASSCSKDTSAPLFPPGEIWYPGHTAERTIHFVNTTGDTRSLSTQAVNSTQTGDIDTVIQFLMQQGGSATTLWNNTLRTLYTTSSIGLPDISPNGTVDLILTITMDSSAGNEFQNKTTTFDLSFTISGVTEPVVVQTVSDGGGGTTTTTTPTTTTNPSLASLPITQLTTLLPRFFIPLGPAVAGAETGPTSEETKEETPILGATTCQTCIWWPLLVLETLGLLFHSLITRHKNKNVFWKGSIFITVFMYVMFLFINRSCRNGWDLWLSTTSFWCKYFILWVLLVFSILSYIFRPKSEEPYEVPPEKPKKE